jgi:hypothetical protein
MSLHLVALQPGCIIHVECLRNIKTKNVSEKNITKWLLHEP